MYDIGLNNDIADMPDDEIVAEWNKEPEKRHKFSS